MIFVKIILSIFLSIPALHGWWWFKKNSELPEEPKKEVIVPTFTLMLYPADSHSLREIEDSFERTISFQCAQELQELIEKRLPKVRVILARKENEPGDFIRAASYANRLHVDFYISLHFYPSKEKISKLFLYHVVYNPGTDFWQTREHDLSFAPYNKAYKRNIKKTHSLGLKLQDQLKKNEKNYHFLCMDLLGIPFRPLLGVIAPAIGIEMGIKKKDDYKGLLQPMVHALENIINTIEPEKNYDRSLQTPPLLTHLN